MLKVNVARITESFLEELCVMSYFSWVPAFAGMTTGGKQA